MKKSKNIKVIDLLELQEKLKRTITEFTEAHFTMDEIIDGHLENCQRVGVFKKLKRGNIKINKKSRTEEQIKKYGKNK